MGVSIDGWKYSRDAARTAGIGANEAAIGGVSKVSIDRSGRRSHTHERRDHKDKVGRLRETETPECANRAEQALRRAGSRTRA